MKKHLLLTLFAGWLASSAYGQTTHHPTYESDALNTSIFVTNNANSRYTGNLIITNTTTHAVTTISDLQTSGAVGNESNGNYVMYDKTATRVIARPGESLTTSNTVGNGTGGMQKQIYIDWNNDGYFGPEVYTGLSDFIQTGSDNGDIKRGDIINPELATYWRIQDNGTWIGPNGVTGGQSEAYNLSLTFTIPEDAEPGNYRARYKYVWNGMNPMGTITGGGIVVDFTIVVRGLTMTQDEAEEALAAYKAGNTILTKSGIFTAEEAAVAFPEIVIDGSATDFEVELAAKQAEVDNAALSVLNSYLDGKKVAFRNNVTHSYIKKANDAGKITRGDTNLTLDAVWQLSFTGEEFIMKNLVDNKYAKNLKADIDNETEAGSYKLVRFEKLNNGSCAIQDCNTTNGTPWLNDNTTDHTLQYKASEAGNTQTFWFITVITEEQEQAWLDEIKQTIDPMLELEIGTKPSTVTFDNTEAYELAKNLTIDNLYSNGYALTTTPLTYTVNPVTPGLLIRIKGLHNTYYSVTNSGASFVSAPDASTLFYYSPYTDASHEVEGGHLIALAHGVAACPTSDAQGMLRGNTTASQNADLAANAKHIFFEVASTDTPRYHFNFYNGDEKRYVYNDGSAAINGGANLSSTTNNFMNYTYTVEQVDEISLTISSNDGIESLISPVALTVPFTDGDATFYSCVTSTNDKGEVELSFTALETETVIAPNTPIMIKGLTGMTLTIPVVYDYAAPAMLLSDDSRFSGSYLTLTHPGVAEGQALFVKTGEALPADGKYTGSEANFKRVNADDEIPAGAVTVVLDDNDPTATNAILSLDKANHSTTEITEIIFGEKAANAEIYDLQGRKLLAPVKGVNIIGGKKVLF